MIRDNDRFWHDVAPALRHERGFEPLHPEDIQSELDVAQQADLSEAEIDSMVEFATAEALQDDKASGSDEELSVEQFVDLVSSSGLVSLSELREFEESVTDERRPKDPREYTDELVKTGKLPRDPSTALHAGAVYGDYLVLNEIGAGGMGRVFRAVHLRMDRTVALKVLSLEAMGAEQNIKRFDREIRAIAKLNHPNIVTAYDAGDTRGVRYLVMEFIDGQDLAKLVRHLGRLSVGLAVDYLQQAAQGLDCAHIQNLIHRDVKPNNLLLDSNGRVKVSDLGLARFLQSGESEPLDTGDDDVTTAGIAIGTHNYMAPEQTRDPSKVDARADIYGLGCTLFFLLVGRSPVQGVSVSEKVAWHRHGEIPSLRAYRSEVSIELDSVFQRMLAKSPDDRFQSMQEVLRALAGCPESPSGESGPQPDSPVGSRADTVTFVKQAESGVAGTESPVETRPEKQPVEKIEDASKPQTKLKWLKLWVVGAVLLAGTITAALLIPRGDAPPEPPLPKQVTNSIEMKLTLIPSGQFAMGAPADEAGSREDERPRHSVRLTRSMYMGTFEVTRKQYESLMNPGNQQPRQREDDTLPPAVDPTSLPVVMVSWEEAIDFCRKLSALPEEVAAGRSYRLPTEAEWEYACRAGRTSAFHFGDVITMEQANFGAQWRSPDSKFPGRPSLLEVGTYEPNAFGLYDMHGNAWEWCRDRYGAYHRDDAVDPEGPKDGKHHVVRGGAYTFTASECRSASRQFHFPDELNKFTGFRVVCELDSR